MPRYIDADALKEKAHMIEIFDKQWVVDEIEIDMAPTADVVPVVRGEWIMDTDPDDGDCRCSNCKACIDALHRRNHKLLNALGYKLHTFYKYCPNCGCDMRGESNGK